MEYIEVSGKLNNRDFASAKIYDPAGLILNIMDLTLNEVAWRWPVFI